MKYYKIHSYNDWQKNTSDDVYTYFRVKKNALYWLEKNKFEEITFMERNKTTNYSGPGAQYADLEEVDIKFED